MASMTVTPIVTVTAVTMNIVTLTVVTVIVVTLTVVILKELTVTIFIFNLCPSQPWILFCFVTMLRYLLQNNKIGNIQKY